MTIFNSKKLDALRSDLNKALEAVTKKHGITIDIGTMRYSDDDVKVSLDMRTVKAGEEGMSRSEADYKAACVFNPTLPKYGSRFTSRGKVYTICGYSSRARKYPVLAKNANGTTYKFTVETVAKWNNQNHIIKWKVSGRKLLLQDFFSKINPNIHGRINIRGSYDTRKQASYIVQMPQMWAV